MASDMVLYWGSGSGPCWKPMIVLEEKKLSGYQSKQISFSNKEHKGEAVMELNPRGQVPTFKHGDIIVNESSAICDYLESQFQGQGNSLTPDDAAGKALVIQRKYEATNLAKIGLEDFLYYLYQTKPEDQDAEKIKEKKEKLATELDRWEGYLSKGGEGTFLAGKAFTMADVFFFPFLAFLVRSGLKLKSKWPQLAAYYDRVSARPSVQASWPPHWKEGEGKDIVGDM